MSYTRESFELADEDMPAGEKAAHQIGIRNVQILETVVNEGLRAALLEENPDRSLEVLLEHLGKGLSAERTYIFEQNEAGGDDNTYEWVAEGVKAEKDNLQNLPPDVCASWYERFSIGKHIVIKDLENIRESEPIQYETLKRQSIHSLVVVPLYDGEQVIGFYGVDNPPAKSLKYVSNMLQTTAYFIVSSLKRRNLVRELRKRSQDVLHALSVDYLGIYCVNFDTDECEKFREGEWIHADGIVNFDEGYQAAMEQYISQYVIPRDQEQLRAVTKKEYVLKQFETKKKFYVRYQVNDSPSGLNYMELHFSTTNKKNCAFFALRDVNALVEQEEQNRLEARRSWEDILQGARTGIWTIEMEEGCQPRMYADRTMRSLLGVPDVIEPEECYIHWFKNIDSDYVAMVQDAVQEMLATGRSEVVYPWQHPELGRIYVRCGGVPDKSFKKPGYGLIGYHQDITEVTMARKKQDQTIMELLDKVKQANATKSAFLSRMSHDLRTPINGILGMLAIMERCLDDEKRQKECRKKVRISTEYMLSLVNDVLQVSKLESGIPTVVEEPFDLQKTLEDCISIMSVQAEERGIRLVLKKVDLQHSKLIGNPLKLKQILLNIINNGLVYNRIHGSVIIRVKETVIGNEMAGYRFVFKDSGSGRREDFQMQEAASPSVENPEEGTNRHGYRDDMSIVKNMIGQLNGTIEIDSQPGNGGIFQFYLPMQIDEEWQKQSAADEQSEEDSIAGMHVLLVEDNEINREIAEFMLEDAGAEVVTAEDGKAAVNTFDASEPGTFDCILMDLMMPVMSGYEATRVIRSLERPDAQTVPIIALSANAFEEDVAMAKDAGMNEHLSKPLNTGMMFKVMSQLRNK